MAQFPIMRLNQCGVVGKHFGLNGCLWVFILLTTLSCRTLPNVSEAKLTEATKKAPKVIAVCFATQGNGFNYPATLSWIAETLYVKIEQAQKQNLSSPDTAKVLFDLGCISGSSSGSLVSNVYSALLVNESLHKGKDLSRLLTAEEVLRLADALRWLAISADLTPQAYLNTLTQVLSEWSLRTSRKAVENIPLLKEVWREILGTSVPSWWDGSYVDREQIIVDFVAMTLLARKMTFATFQERDELGRLIHFPYFPSIKALQDIPEDQRQKIDHGLSNRAKKVNQISEAFLQGQFTPGEYLARYARGVYQRRSSPLMEVGLEPLPLGVCTLTMAALYQKESGLPQDYLDYNELRPTVFCDQQTIKTILMSSLFRSQLQKPNSFAQRLVFLAVNNRRGSMTPSLQEPKMMRPLLGILGGDRIEVSGIFDGLNPVHRDKGELIPVSATQKIRLAVAGGYLDRRMNAWPISYYFAAKVERLQKEGYEVDAGLYLFGKPDVNREKKFDATVIRELFSPNLEVASKNFADWVGIQRDFCQSHVGLLREKGIVLHTTAYNWDMTRVPAAYARRSRIVSYKSANAVRLQTPDMTPLRVAFDPAPEVPEVIPTGATPCFQ